VAECPFISIMVVGDVPYNVPIRQTRFAKIEFGIVYAVTERS